MNRIQQIDSHCAPNLALALGYYVLKLQQDAFHWWKQVFYSGMARKCAEITRLNLQAAAFTKWPEFHEPWVESALCLKILTERMLQLNAMCMADMVRDTVAGQVHFQALREVGHLYHVGARHMQTLYSRGDIKAGSYVHWSETYMNYWCVTGYWCSDLAVLRR